jgi:lactate dehydrogenase-like 2-hydroxyacid dehydrogenase
MTQRPRVLQNSSNLGAIQPQLDERFDIHKLWQEPDPEAFLAARGAEFVGLVTSAQFGADAALMDKLPSLKVISSFGVGFDKVDVAAAYKRGIMVGYTPNVLNDCVADIAWGLLIDVSRGISASDRYVRRGEWPKANYPLQTRVSGKRLGILGLGRIGKAIAKRGEGFSMDIRYTSRNPVADAPYRYEPSLVELARWCDFLVVAAAGGAATRGLVSAAVIEALGPKSFLVNVSRGTVVDEAALVDALVHKRIAGAGLDVFENEPHVPPALFELDNVVLLPHVASATHETRLAMGELVLANLDSYFSRGCLVTPVPAPAGVEMPQPAPKARP